MKATPEVTGPEDRRRSPAAWLSYAILGCSLALLSPFVWPMATGRVFVANDLSDFHIPLRFLYQNALRAGDSLLWTPSLFAGFPLHGEGQLGMFHPLHLALYWCLPLSVAFNLEMLCSYLAAYAGMYWLLRRLELSTQGALFGAMLFAFSGFQVLHFVHVNAVAIAAHIPWMLASIDVIVRAERRAPRLVGFCGASLVLASAVLLGFPQGVWWVLVSASAFLILRARAALRGSALLWCGASVLLGMVLGAIQLLPTLDHVVHSVRAQMPRDFALTYSLYPWNLLQLWSPYGFSHRVIYPFDIPWEHELGVYCGATAPLALAWLWIRRGEMRRRRPLVVWACVFAAVAFVLALGRYGLLDVLLTYLPVLGSLRAPVRYIVLVQFALAVLSALAFEDLLSLDKPASLRRRDFAILSAPAALSILTVMVLNVTGTGRGRLPLATFADAFGGPALFIGITLAVIGAADRRRWAGPLLVIFTAVDLGIWGLGYVTRYPPVAIDQITTGLPRVPDRTRMACPTYCGGDQPILKNYDMVEAYVALFPATRLALYGGAFQQLAGTALILQPNGWLVPVRDGVMPRARLVPDVLVSSDPASDIWNIEVRRTALVDRPLKTDGLQGTATVVLDRPGHIIVKTASLGRQLLTLTERYDSGWIAFVDGRAEPALAVNGDFIGVVVGPGTHRVSFQYAPRSFELGWRLSATGCAALVLIVLFAARRSSSLTGSP